jgi:cobalt-zinc-cadmium efflux system protein
MEQDNGSDRLNEADAGSRRRLLATLAITLAIMAVEVAGGLLSNSVALLSDAGHMVTDAFAIALGLTAAHISARPPDARATYGYQRVGLLAALANGILLLAVSGGIVYESLHRLLAPPRIEVPLMLGVAAAGLAGNLAMALVLGSSHEDLNARSVWLHVLGDTLSSAGVVASGMFVYFTGWTFADPITGIAIACVIAWSGVRLVKDTLYVFLNLTPKGYSIDALSDEISRIPGVKGVHDVHLWLIAHERVAFSAHVLVDDQAMSDADPIMRTIERMLAARGVTHSTLQLECVECSDNGLYCGIGLTDKEGGRHRRG